MGIKREKRRPVQLLALCQLRSGRMERHKRGELIHPDELKTGRLWSGLLSGQYGLRVVEAVAYPTHLAGETRNYGSRAGKILIPLTDAMREADKQAETRTRLMNMRSSAMLRRNENLWWRVPSMRRSTRHG